MIDTTLELECPVSDCDVAIPASLLMCSRHWRQVPPALRERVNTAWRARRRAHRSYIAAIRARESEERLDAARAAAQAALEEHDQAKAAAIHAVETRP